MKRDELGTFLSPLLTPHLTQKFDVEMKSEARGHCLNFLELKRIWGYLTRFKGVLLDSVSVLSERNRVNHSCFGLATKRNLDATRRVTHFIIT